MRKLLNDLLVPMDISCGNFGMVRKAIGLANRLHCNVHLLYFSRTPPQPESADAAGKLKDELDRCRSMLSPTLSLLPSLPEGPPEKAVVNYCKKHKIDLVLLEKKKTSFPGLFRDSLCADNLSRYIGCPILTGSTESDLAEIRNIVLPVSHFLPMGKLLLATYLAKPAGATIHLVSLEPERSASIGITTDSLSRSFQLLKENTSLDIESRILSGTNIATAALAYASSIHADLIMVNPGRESRISGFLRGLRRNFLFDSSPIPVMTIA